MKTEDKWQNAREQAQAQFESIREMVEALRFAEDPDEDCSESVREDARTRIEEDALSVEVRSDWYEPGKVYHGAGNESPMAAEYRILLCTGGPAVQITGELSEYGEPETACLQMQDWFLPWTDWWPDPSVVNQKHVEEILLAYARQFYFGE